MNKAPLEPGKFTMKPATVEAVRVTEDNIEQVAEWCGGTVCETKPKVPGDEGFIPRKYVKVKIFNPDHNHQNRAHIGYWIVRIKRGWKVYIPSLFSKNFIPVDTVVSSHDQDLADYVQNDLENSARVRFNQQLTSPNSKPTQEEEFLNGNALVDFKIPE